MLMRWLLICAALLISSSRTLADEEGEPSEPPTVEPTESVEESAREEPSAFEKRLKRFFMPGYFWLVQSGVTIDLGTLAKYPVRENFDTFPEELIAALRKPGSKDCSDALGWLSHYAMISRGNADYRGVRDLAAATVRTFGSPSNNIRVAIKASLRTLKGEDLCSAALVLLAFDPHDEDALRALAAGFQEGSGDLRLRCCELVGAMRLTGESVIKLLIQGLKDSNPDVRRHAAVAISRIGPAAKKTIPELITLLQDSETAKGTVHPVGTISQGSQENVALLALRAIGTDARAAMPVILDQLRTTEDVWLRRELLASLADLTPTTPASLATIRSFLKDPDKETLLTAACVLARLAPNDRRVVSLIIEALEADEKRSREPEPDDVEPEAWEIGPSGWRSKRTWTLSLEVILKTPPRRTAVVPAMVRFLDTEKDGLRTLASRALGAMGPAARDAIPALEKVLSQKEDGQKHTFMSHGAAANALADIGRASVPALIRLLDPKSQGGRDSAMYALGRLGKDAKPAVSALAKCVANDSDIHRMWAAMALGMIGPSACEARPTLVKVNARLRGGFWKVLGLGRLDLAQQTHEIRMFTSWALNEIPE